MHNTQISFWSVAMFVCLGLALQNRQALAQSCADPGLQSVIRIFAEYSDVRATCEVADLADGPVDFVDITYDDYPGIFSFVSSHSAFLRWKVYLSPELVNVTAVMDAITQHSSEFWVIDVDEDGDLRMGRFMEPLGDVHLEAEFLQGTQEILELIRSYPSAGSASSTSQIPTTDDYEMSVQGCMRGVLSEWEGLDIPEGMNVRAYCECIADKLRSDSDELSEIFDASSDDFTALIEGCLDDLMPGLGDYSLDELDGDKMQAAIKRGYMRGCMREASSVLDNLGQNDARIAEQYCECMYENLLTQESFNFSDFEDVNSVVMTEIDAACSHILLGESTPNAHEYWNQSEGCHGIRSTPFLVNSGGEVKVKVSFGEIEKYLTLDSGCSEVILNEDLAKSLKIAGDIGPGDYLGLEMFTLADGRDVAIEKYRVRQMKVGSCVMHDFVVGVIEEGGMLLGMGYLSLFDSWELDQSAQTLRTTN